MIDAGRLEQTMKPGWFGPKRIGIGASPRSWQGWVVIVVMLALLAALVRYCKQPLQTAMGLPSPIVTIAILAVWFAILLGIIALTYEDDRKPDGRK
jgi:hypothetical protein